MTKKAIRVGGGIFLLGVIVAVLISGCGGGGPQPVTTGSLTIFSSPSGAHVYLDGKDTGAITPVSLTDIEEGPHTLTLTLGTGEPWSAIVTVTAGETTYVTATIITS